MTCEPLSERMEDLLYLLNDRTITESMPIQRRESAFENLVTGQMLELAASKIIDGFVPSGSGILAQYNEITITSSNELDDNAILKSSITSISWAWEGWGWP